MSDSRKIIKKGVFLLAVVFAVLSIFFSSEYISGASQNISYSSVMALAVSFISLVSSVVI